MLALGLLPGTALGAPDHDEYQQARPLGLGDRDDPAHRTNAGATTSAGEPLACGPVQMAATVWYRVSGTGGPVTLNTVGSTIDTVMAVYDTGGGAPSTGNRIACHNDRWPGEDDQYERASEIVFPSQAGRDYLVQIGSCAGCGGGFPATGGVEFMAFRAPSNDARASAQPLTLGRSQLTSNLGATTEPGERAECGPDHPYGKTVWYRFTAPSRGVAVVTTGGGFDAVTALYRGATHLACNDDGTDLVGPSRIALRLEPGEHLVQVGGWGDGIRAAYGDFTVQVDFMPDPPPDRDGDGVADGDDRCADENARARDADGDGCLDPPPPPPLKSLRSTLTTSWAWTRGYTLVQVLRVNALPAGATVRVTCSARPRRRCPYRARSFPIRRSTRKLDLRKPFKARRLPVGTTLTITITAPGYEGKVFRYRTRRGRRPSVRQLCLAPGASRPAACV